MINDPVHGFLTISSDILFDLIEHPFFQRLRRIRQLGLTNVVYPAANHTRFQHALGSLFLMETAIKTIRSKGHAISDTEAEAASIAILLHDIGHGPFSHALEKTIIQGISHEYMSKLFMEELNRQFDGKLSLAMDIFTNKYHKKFLHELVSSQLDMDRLDYLKRDSLSTGVVEGIISSDRIIDMLNIVNGKIVVEEKGIYSIEKFVLARRLMYWQVYLHKTVIAAEWLLVNILTRAKELSKKGTQLFATPSLRFFLSGNINKSSFMSSKKRKEILAHFSALDDSDIIAAIKVWANEKDIILSVLCNNFLDRKLCKIEISDEKVPGKRYTTLLEKAAKKYDIPLDDAHYFVFSGSITNNLYDISDEKILILTKQGKVINIEKASDILDISILTKKGEKFFLCYPKNL